jgi:hypothetical protein
MSLPTLTLRVQKRVAAVLIKDRRAVSLSDFHQGAYNVKPMGKKLVTFMAMLDASDN